MRLLVERNKFACVFQDGFFFAELRQENRYCAGICTEFFLYGNAGEGLRAANEQGKQEYQDREVFHTSICL